ncbi:hypothetical protein BV898_03214 [Hypsibius exemplaris]|uniref:PNPLA domain-containing protein n=1 Tax=Hypsibius exemplaris TaxID=2072580 RepID=A0A1W0X5C3_HYPEX|nr:hypothetical protein BV898_03214 [Hypsibius exemplaris]
MNILKRFGRSGCAEQCVESDWKKSNLDMWCNAIEDFLKDFNSDKIEMTWMDDISKKPYKLCNHSEVDRKIAELVKDSKWESLDIERQLLLTLYHDTYKAKTIKVFNDFDGDNTPDSTPPLSKSFVDMLPSVTFKCHNPGVTGGCLGCFKNLKVTVRPPSNAWHDDPSLAFPPGGTVLSVNQVEAAARMKKRERNKNGLRILVLDGGGVRGRLHAIALQFFQAQGLRSILGSFDMICGTSAGGLTALYLVYGAGRFTQADSITTESSLLYDMAETLPKKIFQKASWFQKARLFFSTGAITDTLHFEKELVRIFRGANMMENESPRCFVVANRQQGQINCKCIIRNYEIPKDAVTPKNVVSTIFIPVAGAARMTTAAPYYFTPVRQDGDFVYQDGGLQENSPAHQARREAALIFPGRPIDVVVSLGTGRQPKGKTGDDQPENFRPSAKETVFQTTKALFEQIPYLKINSEQQWADFVEDNPDIQYKLRVDPQLEREISLADVSEASVTELMRLAQAELHEKTNEIKKVVEFLNSDPFDSSVATFRDLLKAMEKPDSFMATFRNLLKTVAEFRDLLGVMGEPVSSFATLRDLLGAMEEPVSSFATLRDLHEALQTDGGWIATVQCLLGTTEKSKGSLDLLRCLLGVIAASGDLLEGMEKPDSSIALLRDLLEAMEKPDSSIATIRDLLEAMEKPDSSIATLRDLLKASATFLDLLEDMEKPASSFTLLPNLLGDMEKPDSSIALLQSLLKAIAEFQKAIEPGSSCAKFRDVLKLALE